MPVARVNDKIIHFIHIPKTGGSTVTSYLRAIGNVAFYSRDRVDGLKTTPQHFDIETSKILLPDGFVDARFAILRDPLERMCSEFRYRHTRFMQKNPESRVGHKSDEFRLDLDWGEFFLGTFDEWAKLVMDRYAKDVHACDNHIRPQSDFVDDSVKLFIFEEGLQVPIEWINKFAGIAPTAFIPDTNSSIPVPLNISRKTRNIIKDFYSDDYALMSRRGGVNPLAAKKMREGVS